MANAKNGRKKFKKVFIGLLVIILLTASVAVLEPSIEDEYNPEIQVGTNESGDPLGELMLTMIDCGQADSFLLQQNGVTCLIDCGTRSTGKEVVKYLQKKGIEKIDYLFGTHPHEDHMGGMYTVITNLEVGKIIIPNTEAENITTTWYMNLMSELANDKYDVEYAKLGTIYNLGQAIIKIIGPINVPEDGNLNNYSTVLKVTFGDMDVIMTGDAETQVEEAILNSGEDLDAELLKIGHHGSITSTSEEFLDAVSPDYALISVKLGNKYEHPMYPTLEKLESRNIVLYRTDENSTVVVTITAKAITFNCEPGDYRTGSNLKEEADRD